MVHNANLTLLTACFMLAAVIANFSSLFIIRKGVLINPIAYFIGVFTIQIVGTYPLLDMSLEHDYWHGLLILMASCTVLSYCIWSGVSKRGNYATLVRSRMPDLLLDTSELIKVSFLLVISIAASLLYYRIVGYNLFIEALSGRSNDFTTMRLQAYSGDNYTAPGVFNQFKNTILPICFFSIIIYLMETKKYFVLLFFILTTTPLVLYCILGTGQRAFLFYSLVIFIITMVNQKKKNVPIIALFLGGFLVLFGLYSVLLGRQAEGSEGVIAVLGQLYYRIFAAQQLGSVMGFRYIYPLDTTWGYEWLQGFVGLVPGLPGSDLSHQVHAFMYGSLRGTAPVSFWVSAYHNFGLLGVVVAGWLWLSAMNRVFGFIVQLKKSALNRVIISSILLYSGLSVVAQPAQVFNNGIFGIILIFAFCGVKKYHFDRRPVQFFDRMQRSSARHGVEHFAARPHPN